MVKEIIELSLKVKKDVVHYIIMVIVIMNVQVKPELMKIILKYAKDLIVIIQNIIISNKIIVIIYQLAIM